MPRDGSGVYSKPAGTTASPNTTIESAKYNAFADDLVTDANAARPLTAGGTGATTKQGAVDALFDGTTRVDDDNFKIVSNADSTKVVVFDLSGLTTANTRTITVPNASGKMALTRDLRGQLFGLTLTNNATDATNDIDVAAGDAATDATAPVLMTLSSTFTKRLDAAWAVGTGNGGLDTGSVANGTYYVFLIQRSDTLGTDVLFSTSSTSPTMPTSYDRKRLIGSVVRASAANGIPISYTKPEFRMPGSAPAFAARAWGVFVGGSSPTIGGSGNVASITYNSTGSFTVNFTTAMPDTNYAVILTVDRSSSISFAAQVVTRTTGGFTIRTYDGSSFSNVDFVHFAVFR
jgi:hypothetical protein